MMDDEIRKLKERIRSRQLIPRLLPGLFPFDSRGKLRITTFFLGFFSGGGLSGLPTLSAA